MEKLKNFIKWVANDGLKNAIKWIGTDGLLHFLICYAMMVALSPIIGWWALLPTAIIAAAKEGYDLHISKSNNKEQVIHDLLCDLVGIVAAYLTMIVWFIRIL